MSEVIKPPIGVMPKLIWLENRARDLQAAIDRYTEYYAHSAQSPVNAWEIELRWVLNQIDETCFP